MSRERENYRLNLEGVLAAFPDSPFPTLREVATYLRKDVRQLQSDKDFMKLCRAVKGRTHMTRESLAHWMCGN